MKKVFAFLSTLLLTIAFVGIFAVSKPAVAANKITEDPTLAEDEIPVYIMNSIYSTFPNYYDNDAKADEFWGGPSRMYPWNETRMRVAQLDEEGNPTGKYYAVYFAGHTTAVEKDGSEVIGAGKNILFWNVDANGNPVVEKYSDGKIASTGQASDPSLSHMRTNISGQDLTVDPLTFSWGDEGKNFYNRSIVFDAEGNIVRAIGLDDIYTSAEGEYKMAPEYCYVDGVVTKMEEDTVCDKVKVAQTDEEGNPVLDEEGNPVYVDGEESNILYSRFVYEYFEEKPENVNTVAYLSEGWDPALWDYCYEEGDGWICIAFVGSADGTAHKIKGDQITAYQNTLIAQGKTEEEAATIAASTTRECVRELRIPAGGWTFDYGYLDKGTGNDAFFNDTVIKGYKYGRTVVSTEEVEDEEGNVTVIEKGLGEQRTYDFSVSGLYFKDKVIDGQSYQLLNGQNVVEVMQGSVVNPAQSIVYTGVSRFWGTKNDLTSYTSSDEALEFYITESINGAGAITVVQPPQGYSSQEEMAKAFTADFNEYLIKRGSYKLNEETGAYEKKDAEGNVLTFTPLEVPTKENKISTSSAWYNARYELAHNGVYGSFVDDAEYWAEWSWMFEYMNLSLGAANGLDLNTKVVASPGNFVYTVWAFLCEHELISGWPSSKVDWSNGAATGWIATETSKDLWNAYQIDASMAAPNDNWVINYKVINSATGVSSDITIKYVVVDSYTPIIKVDANKLLYVPKIVADLVVCDPIDEYEIVKAYDAQYNGVDIEGNDISQNIEFETELDFDNPKEGVWPVVATIYNNAGTKKASVKFNIDVRDITAPNAVTRKVVIQQGQDFDCRDGIVLAVDNVDGDLTKQAYTWWEETSNPVDTSKDLKGKNATYNIKVSLFDKAGNERQISYSLVVVADKFTTAVSEDIADLVDGVEGLSDSLQDVLDAQDELSEAVAELQGIVAELTGLEGKIDALEALVNEVKQSNAALKEDIAGVNGSVEDVQTGLDEVAGSVADVQTSVDGVADEVEAIEAEIEEVAGAVAGLAEGCGKNGTALVLQIAGAAALLALVLRKRH